MFRFPPKKILVAFDFSGLSAAAWRQAADLARRFDAEIEAVHVAEWPPAAELAPLPASSEEKEKIVSRIRERIGARPKISLAFGDPALAILRAARARRADLLVLGTHGRTGLTRALLGSVAEAVVRRSRVPVLAVRGDGGAIRSVLAPVNFTGYSYYGFAYAAAAAAFLKASLTALHVHVDPIWNGDPARKLAKLLEPLPAELRKASRPLIETGQSDPTRGILKAGARHDLIVLVAHETSAIRDMILGTTAERVLRRSPASVLVVPAPRGRLPLRRDQPTACCATP